MTRIWLEEIYMKVTQCGCTIRKGLTPKLARPWKGPFIVTKKINDLVSDPTKSKIQAKGASSKQIMEVHRAKPPDMVLLPVSMRGLPKMVN